MKRVIFIFLLSIMTGAGFSRELHNYAAVKSAVENGHMLRIAVNYTRCTSQSPAQFISPNRSAFYTPNAIAIDTKGNIGFYVLYFTNKDGIFPGKNVYEYGRYLISPEGKLDLTFTVFSMPDYNTLGEDYTLSCAIDEGFKVFLVH